MAPFEQFIKAVADAIADGEGSTDPARMTTALAGAMGDDPCYMIFLCASMYELWRKHGWAVGWQTKWLLTRVRH